MHTVKSFGVDSEADVFLESPCFLRDPKKWTQLNNNNNKKKKKQRKCITYKVIVEFERNDV